MIEVIILIPKANINSLFSNVHYTRRTTCRQVIYMSFCAQEANLPRVTVYGHVHDITTFNRSCCPWSYVSIQSLYVCSKTRVRVECGIYF